MSNISKTVTDTTMGSMEAEYETDPGLLIGIVQCNSWQLDIPRLRTGFAQRSFTYSAPHIWNSLPDDIASNLNVTAHTFKNKLKTFFYRSCYS